MPHSVPQIRVTPCNDAAVNEDGNFVLYWMIAFRRPTFNSSLDRAIELADELGKPVFVLEALRCDYRWASDRLHRFVMQGMTDNRRAFDAAGVTYHPYVEPQRGAGKGLLKKLSERACAIVTDDYPCFFLPRMVRAAAEKLAVRVEMVDSNGLLPLAAADKVYARAFDFRRYLQKELPRHLDGFPAADPLENIDLPRAFPVPDEVEETWPAASEELLEATPERLAQLPIDHEVGPAAFDGGPRAAQNVLQRFLNERLDRYADGRNDPDDNVSSELSPYLHFGHIAAHDVFRRIADRENWSPKELGKKTKGQREGWWNMSPAAESFLDELITWREVGYNMTSRRDDYGHYESLPDWALESLEEHAGDKREHVYTLEEFERAETHDRIWNAAQNQLVRDGRLHNYMRMLWGKKILHWSASPREALDIMIELNNKYAVDGRDPNSYSGIFWVLGRYDRAWGPERPIFGKIRYMSCESARKKLQLDEYVERYAGD